HDRDGDGAAMRHRAALGKARPRRPSPRGDRVARRAARRHGAHLSPVVWVSRPKADSRRAASARRCWVSTSTVALMPERSGGSSSFGVSRTRTGTRWTILTQLPVAFCGGRIENSDPVPGLMPETVPVKSWLG